MPGKAHTHRGHPAGQSQVLTLTGLGRQAVGSLLAQFGIELVELDPGAPIPGSYWGEEEAGLIGRRLLARPDTPVHSILHEASHYVCMTPARRHALDTDAGGDFDEENAVCYLQILLADHLPGMGRARMLADMDRWGYSFRLGSAGAWFSEDAADARRWLTLHGIIDDEQRVSWTMRQDGPGAES
jgi:hypothetical protein